MKEELGATSEAAAMAFTPPIMPFRLIDVRATLTHCQPSGGLFFTRQPSWHVISHTWSADVRHFSTVIGELAASTSGSSYEALFEAAGFGSHPAYLELIQFLMILHGKHVQWVWFDAVCINQKDATEKDHEIQHMGTYYQSSLGCYVVHHGFGKGFRLLLDSAFDDEQVPGSSCIADLLPRWYSRAWTFQEWVLPPMVTFILDLASEQMLRKTAVIALFRHRNAPASSGCLCCEMSYKFIVPWFLWECMNTEASTSYSCLCWNRQWKCILPSCLRKCIKSGTTQDYNLASYCKPCRYFTKVPGKDHWYFVDDVGYAFLLKLKFYIMNADGSIGEDSVLLDNAQASMTERMVAKQSVLRSRIPNPGSSGDDSETSIHEVIEEISQRECSNPEDRVLSVLKLLGVEHMLQVRTGKTLQMQLLEFGRSLLNSAQHELLLKMCLVDAFGSEMAGMSWMPEFEVKKGSWQEEARYLRTWMSIGFTFSNFNFSQAKSMRCLGICDVRGELEVEGHGCAGEFIFCDHDKSVEEYRMSKFDESNRSFYEKYRSRTMVLQVGGQVVFHLCARISAQNTCFVQGVDPEQWMAYSYIAFPAPNIHVLQHIPVWLLGLGNVEKKGMCLLVCVGDQQLGLHKIGYLLGLSPSWFTLNSRLTHCKIGGLGKWVPNTCP